MIKDLFDYEDLLEFDCEYSVFSNCKMLRDFGNAKAGDEFEMITVVIAENKIEFYSSEDQDTPDFTHLYSLTYVKNS